MSKVPTRGSGFATFGLPSVQKDRAQWKQVPGYLGPGREGILLFVYELLLPELKSWSGLQPQDSKHEIR